MHRITKSPRTIVREDGMGEGILWVLSIDGQILTENARPFDAGTPSIKLHECDFCFYCGIPEIVARRFYSHSILWYVQLDDAYTPLLARDRILIFDRSEYEAIFGGDSNCLPEFSSNELADLARQLLLPNWRDGLYTIPELPKDGRGQTILRLLAESTSSPEIIVRQLHSEPMPMELRIGLELPGIPETVVRFEHAEDEWWFQWISNPAIPLLLSHPQLSEPLSELLAGSTLPH